MPQGEFRSKQHYLSRSQVLETLFETPMGHGVLTDWMPIDSAGTNAPMICRKLKVMEGTIEWTLQCTPRFQYGENPAQAERHPRGVLFRGAQPEDLAILQADIPLQLLPNHTTATAQFTLRAGESTQILWIWGRSGTLTEISSDKKIKTPELQSSLALWHKIAHRCASSSCPLSGPWHELVIRSGLVLKALTTPFSGSIADAVTITLKGHSSGHLWDYRQTSLRDGSYLLQAFTQLGYIEEAHAFFSWVHTLIDRDGAENLQAHYTLDGSRNLPERTLPYWVPHENPKHFQLDIFGHVALTASQYYKLFKKFPDDLWPKLVEIADYVSQAWRRPDHGPWNYSGRPEHFVASKLFCWVTLREICWLADVLLKPTSPRWITEKNTLHRTICKQGFDSGQNSFIRSFGENEVDSSLLWLILLDFLPQDDPRIQGTLHSIQTLLSDGIFIRRSRARFDFQGEEPIDLLSSLQFTTCLALVNRIDEAKDRLAELCSYAHPLGLLGDQLTNAEHPLPRKFPSVTVHTYLIHCAAMIGATRASASQVAA